MGRVRGGRERGSVFRRRRVRGVVLLSLVLVLLTCRRCLAGAEGGSRVSQIFLNPRCERVRAAEDASRGPLRLL